jgi:hypothetical protein
MRTYAVRRGEGRHGIITHHRFARRVASGLRLTHRNCETE